MSAGRRWLPWAAVSYALILLAVFLGLRHLYDSSREKLDEAMGQRLLGVARSVAALCDGELVMLATLSDSSGLAYLDELAAVCGGLQQAESLAEITLSDPVDGRVLMSTSAALRPGEMNAFLALDPGAVAAARSGVAAAGPLYRAPHSPDTFQKSAHAPVFHYSAEGPYPVGLLTVSGSPDFFVALERLRRAAWLTAAVVLAVMAGLGVVLQRILVALERTREAVRRQENLAAMGRMTAGIAHEIRNPLGIIRGAGQHLERVLADAGLEDEVAAFIPEEVDRLDRILSGYLAFGTEQAAPAEDFELAACLRRGVRLMADELRATGVSVEGPDVGDPWRVRGDPRRLQQVCLNLLLNARDAMPEGGRVHLALALSRDETQVVVTVTDEGPGLGGVDRQRLFEPFWTTREKGSGLGLAISRRIVEDMGGTLELCDRGDRRGAEARLSLPRLPESKG
jgi:two-component system sensor histidine kinase HydH